MSLHVNSSVLVSPDVERNPVLLASLELMAGLIDEELRIPVLRSTSGYMNNSCLCLQAIATETGTFLRVEAVCTAVLTILRNKARAISTFALAIDNQFLRIDLEDLNLADLVSTSDEARLPQNVSIPAFCAGLQVLERDVNSLELTSRSLYGNQLLSVVTPCTHVHLNLTVLGNVSIDTYSVGTTLLEVEPVKHEELQIPRVSTLLVVVDNQLAVLHLVRSALGSTHVVIRIRLSSRPVSLKNERTRILRIGNVNKRSDGHILNGNPVEVSILHLHTKAQCAILTYSTCSGVGSIDALVVTVLKCSTSSHVYLSLTSEEGSTLNLVASLAVQTNQSSHLEVNRIDVRQ